MALKDLLERRARTIAAMREITTSPAGSGGDLSEDQAVRFDEMRGDLAKAEKDIERAQALDDAERRMAGQPVTGSGDNRFDDECRSFSLLRAIASQVPNLNVDAGREREISQELQRRSGRTAEGITVPLSVFHQPMERRVITTAAPVGGPGGNIIATDHLGNQFIDILRASLRVRQLGATVLSGLRGNVDIPRLKASATAGWVAENAGLSASDQEYDKVSMTPKHCGCLAEFSRNMLMQSSPDIESLIRRDFAAVLASAVDRVAIKGGGANEPTGILGTSGIGSVVCADPDGGAPTRDDLIDLIGEVDVDDALAGNLAFLGNAKVRKTLLKLKDGEGLPFTDITANALVGYLFATTSNVPSNLTKAAGSNLSALIFGNWADLLLGYWSEFDLLVNPYESTAYAKGNVQVRGMLTMDVDVRHAQSFAAIQDMVTS